MAEGGGEGKRQRSDLANVVPATKHPASFQFAQPLVVNGELSAVCRKVFRQRLSSSSSLSLTRTAAMHDARAGVAFLVVQLHASPPGNSTRLCEVAAAKEYGRGEGTHSCA